MIKEILEEFEKDIQQLNNNGMADIPSVIGLHRQSLLSLLQKVREENEKTLESHRFLEVATSPERLLEKKRHNWLLDELKQEFIKNINEIEHE